jgi:hypothetical protein
MHRTGRLLIAVMAALFLAGCAAHGVGENGPGEPRDRNVLTHEELNAVAYQSAYHAVEALRSNWLRTRGASGPGATSADQVAVLLNTTRMGGPEALRSLSTRDISSIRFYDATTAASRFGRDFAHGAIVVSTERR